jgi:hypothetical protein
MTLAQSSRVAACGYAVLAICVTAALTLAALTLTADGHRSLLVWQQAGGARRLDTLCTKGMFARQHACLYAQVAGVTIQPCATAEDLMRFFQGAIANRVTMATKMNDTCDPPARSAAPGARQQA